jgi:hypothetical protein
MWEPVFENRDTNYKFNSFLYTFLKIYEASFPLQNKSIGETKNGWITHGIKISCKRKRNLYNNPHMRAYYTKYCKILNSYKRG